MALDKYGYRQYLRDKGLQDNEITYDADKQAVMAKGKFFANAAPEADGSTYGTRGNLDAMYKAYQTQNMPSYADRSNTLLNKAEERLGQTAKSFEYNAQADPLYQNALQAAQKGAQTATNNAMVSLGRRGIGNSQSAVTSANGIQQNAIGDVNSKVLPQLTAQAYQRYVDEQQMGRQNTQDLLGLGQAYSNLDQRGLDNAYRQDTFDYGKQTDQRNFDYQAGRDQVADTQFNQKFDYQKARDQIGDEQYKQKFDEDVRRFGLDYAMKAADQANAFANRAADNARANDANKLAREKFEFDKSQASGSGSLSKELDGLYTGLTSGQIEAGAAIDEINQKLGVGLLTPQEASQMLALVQNVASKKPVQATPQLTQDQIDANGGSNPQDLNSNQLEKLWSTDPTGKAAGAPQIDWAQWYRDPRGKQGGVSFQAWRQAYGPRLGK